MTARTKIKLLATLCVVQFGVIAALVVWRTTPDEPVRRFQDPFAAGTSAPAPRANSAPSVAAPAAAPADVAQKLASLEKEAAALKQELDMRRSEISFSYGTLRDSGRFVGMTFRKMFEAAAARGEEAQAKLADNQLNVLSLGPFIQDAEVLESDPVSFAEFQTALLSEVLELPPARRAEVEGFLADLKARSMGVEMGSAEWAQFNDAAYARVAALLPEIRQQSLRPQLEFLQRYGVLMIPAYSILGAPVPTIAPPAESP